MVGALLWPAAAGKAENYLVLYSSIFSLWLDGCGKSSENTSVKYFEMSWITLQILGLFFFTCFCTHPGCQLDNESYSDDLWVTVSVQLFLLLDLSLWSIACIIPAVRSPALWAGKIAYFPSSTDTHTHTHSCVVCNDSPQMDGRMDVEWMRCPLNCQAWIFDCSAVKSHLGTLNAILILFCEAQWGNKCTFFFKLGLLLFIVEIAGLANYKDCKVSDDANGSWERKKPRWSWQSKSEGVTRDRRGDALKV